MEFKKPTTRAAAAAIGLFLFHACTGDKSWSQSAVLAHAGMPMSAPNVSSAHMPVGGIGLPSSLGVTGQTFQTTGLFPPVMQPGSLPPTIVTTPEADAATANSAGTAQAGAEAPQQAAETSRGSLEAMAKIASTPDAPNAEQKMAAAFTGAQAADPLSPPEEAGALTETTGADSPSRGTRFFALGRSERTASRDNGYWTLTKWVPSLGVGAVPSDLQDWPGFLARMRQALMKKLGILRWDLNVFIVAMRSLATP